MNMDKPVSEIYLRAVAVALKRGLSAVGKVCTFTAGEFEFTFNGTRQEQHGIAPLHLKANRIGEFLPIALVAPHEGIFVGRWAGVRSGDYRRPYPREREPRRDDRPSPSGGEVMPKFNAEWPTCGEFDKDGVPCAQPAGHADEHGPPKRWKRKAWNPAQEPGGHLCETLCDCRCHQTGIRSACQNCGNQHK